MSAHSSREVELHLEMSRPIINITYSTTTSSVYRSYFEILPIFTSTFLDPYVAQFAQSRDLYICNMMGWNGGRGWGVKLEGLFNMFSASVCFRNLVTGDVLFSAFLDRRNRTVRLAIEERLAHPSDIVSICEVGTWTRSRIEF